MYGFFSQWRLSRFVKPGDRADVLLGDVMEVVCVPDSWAPVAVEYAIYSHEGLLGGSRRVVPVSTEATMGAFAEAVCTAAGLVPDPDSGRFCGVLSILTVPTIGRGDLSLLTETFDALVYGRDRGGRLATRRDPLQACPVIILFWSRVAALPFNEYCYCVRTNW